MANEAGQGCVVRASGITGYTFVSKQGASTAGSVTRVAFYHHTAGGTSGVSFAFFTASGDNLTTVAGSRVTGLTGMAGAGCNEFNAGVDFTAFSVSLGDYVGVYSGTSISYTASGGAGYWYKSGDQTNVSSVAFTADADGLDSLTADITAPAGGNPWNYYAQQ